MSLHPQPIGPVPDETTRVARTAFRKDSLYMQMRDAWGSLYTDENFADLGLPPKRIQGVKQNRSVEFIR